MACITNQTFPHKSTCQNYLGENDICQSDLECPFDMFCWSDMEPLPANKLRRVCMKRFYLNDTVQFGWISQYKDDSSNIAANGQACLSGFAFKPDDTKNIAECGKVQSVYSDQGDVTTSLVCTAGGVGATCDYFFSSFHNNVYFHGPCECSLDQSSGYCPMYS